MDPTFGECIKKVLLVTVIIAIVLVEKNIGILLFSYFYMKL